MDLLFSFLLVIVLIAVLSPHAVMAGDIGEVVDLVLSPSNQTVNPDETFTIAIEARCNGQDITGISAFLDYEPDYLEVLSVTPGSTLPLVLQNTYDNPAGTIDYSAGKLSQPFPNNTFTLAIISFKAKGAAATTRINFRTTDIRTTKADYGGVSKLNNIVGATVTIPSTSTNGSTTSPPSEPESGTTDVSNITTDKGVFSQVAMIQTEDGACKLIIDKGTIALTKDRKPISEIAVTEMEESPLSPQGAKVVGSVYNLGPDGAIFETPINLAVAYAPAEIPEGIAEEDLVLAWWDIEAGKWVELVSNVNTNANAVTANVEHFTAFTILGYEAVREPAAFIISSLSILPEEVDVGEEVTISLAITNTGGELGSYQVTLKINGVPESSKHVTINAGSSEKISFITAEGSAGKYSVDVNGLTGSFKVSGEPASPAPLEVDKQTVPSPAPSPAPPLPPAPQDKPVNWPVLWGVIGGVVVVGLLIFLVAKRRPY